MRREWEYNVEKMRADKLQARLDAAEKRAERLEQAAQRVVREHYQGTESFNALVAVLAEQEKEER